MKFAIIAAAVLLPAVSALSTAAQAAGDPAEGEKVFRTCMTCHKVGEGAKNAVGPQLNGLFGRKAGTAPDYKYSAAYQSLDKVWDEENFRVYIKDPKGVTPGTKMAFAGIKGADADTKIDNLIAYLKQFKADGTK
jgi:cytochrome c